MAGILPATLDWTAVVTELSAFYALPLVTGAILFGLAVRFGPAAARAIFRTANRAA